jgi:hypothetical protein
MRSIVGISLALSFIAGIGQASADEAQAWGKSVQGKCLMDRGDRSTAKFAAADANCGPVGDSSRASRAFVLANAFADVARAVNSGDTAGAQDVMNVLWQAQNRSPMLTSCWKTMIKVCDAAEIGKTIDASHK